jgi:16S rRNA (uracil1498-N3)-methyltransferase
MHRFYLPPELSQQDGLLLTEREAHHALHVLRLRRGDRVTVLDGAGHEFLCEISESGRSNLRLRMLEKRFIPASSFQITLVQAVPKGKLFETVIQKAAELGASRLVPLLTERTIPQVSHTAETHKAGKWQSIAIEAIKQCGCAWLPKVEAPLTPRQFIERKENFELPLIASLQPGSRHPREYFNALRMQQGRPPRSVCIWIGPEGDFTPGEVEMIQSTGALPITLGPLVLRTDTAAVYCLSIVNYELSATIAT